MHITIKSGFKIVKPSSRIDEVFESQGFKKKGGKDFPYYRLRIDDICTRTSYELQIPIQEIYLSPKESLYKFQEMIIHTRSPVKPHQIPEAIIQAAKEKMNEVFSTLSESKPSIKI
ncbi:MAG: hypothetical protein ACH0QD_03485 [Tepidibacillus sp.]